MQIDRRRAPTPRTTALAEAVAGLRGPCLGCPGCRGLCHDLIAAMVVPETVLRRGHEA